MVERIVRQRIHKLWDDLAEFGAARIEKGLVLALKELSVLLDAQQAYWLGTVRLTEPTQDDPVFGWRPRAIRYLHDSEKFKSVYREQCRRIEAGKPSPSIAAKVLEAGNFRVIIQHEIDGDEWSQSDLYDTHYGPIGIQDIILVATPLGEEVESWFAFERIRHPKPLFCQADRLLLDYAVRPLKWFHQKIMLNHGILVAMEPLKPTERRLLSLLHTDRSEREIAAKMGLTPTTVHTYATRIYRKFNVKGRAGLAALWLGRMGR